jgi:hypothetical protein
VDVGDGNGEIVSDGKIGVVEVGEGVGRVVPPCGGVVDAGGVELDAGALDAGADVGGGLLVELLGATGLVRGVAELPGSGRIRK